MTVPWRSLDLFVVPNWFLCTDTANDDTIFFPPYGIPSRDLFSVPVCVRNVHHMYQFPDYLVVVAMVIPSVMLRMPLVTISRR